MTPYMFRTIGLAFLAVAAAIALIWLLQELDVFSAIDNPLAGVIGFGVVGAILYILGKRGAGHHSAQPPDRDR